MCWNAEVSLNTFVFSTFVLILVYYNNEYTKYKIPMFQYKWLYIFFMLAFSMQLVEYFLWKNINNKYNSIITIYAFILLFCQPIASLMLLKTPSIRNTMLTIYLLIGIPYILYIILNKKFRSTVSTKGNIQWNLPIPTFLHVVWLFMLLFSFVYEKRWISLIFAVVTFAIFIYKELSSSGSTWCWFINGLSIYFAVYLLFYLPFCENRTIC